MVLPQIFLALALIASSDAFPFQNEKRSFAINQVERRSEGNSTYVKSGAHAYAHALRKYNAPAADIELVERAAAVSASGSVVAEVPSYADVEYDCPVTIGSQTFRLDLDTGSSDTWVLGSATGAKSPHTLYKPGKTATLQSGSTWKIGYGDGSSASGTVYLDTVKFGKMTITGQAVEMASKASSAFTTTSRPADGLMGLAFDKLNTISPKQSPTFFTNAINQGLPKKLFTVRLRKGAAGTYNFGAINASEYSGSITYANVDSSQGFWTFSPSSYSINGKAQTLSSGVTLKGIADTGTTLLLLDPRIVSNYYSSVSKASYVSSFGGYVFPCSTTMPSLTFSINGYKATTPGSYMAYAKVNSTYCYGGLQSNSGIGFNIYGDVFLKSQFVVFDKTQTTPRLGFATPK